MRYLEQSGLANIDYHYDMQMKEEDNTERKWKN
jgi:hypothetical protein